MAGREEEEPVWSSEAAINTTDTGSATDDKASDTTREQGALIGDDPCYLWPLSLSSSLDRIEFRSPGIECYNPINNWVSPYYNIALCSDPSA